MPRVAAEVRRVHRIARQMKPSPKACLLLAETEQYTFTAIVIIGRGARTGVNAVTRLRNSAAAVRTGVTARKVSCCTCLRLRFKHQRLAAVSGGNDAVRIHKQQSHQIVQLIDIDAPVEEFDSLLAAVKIGINPAG